MYRSGEGFGGGKRDFFRQRKMWTVNVIGNMIRGSLSMDLRIAGFVEFF